MWKVEVKAVIDIILLEKHFIILEEEEKYVPSIFTLKKIISG